MEPKLITIKSLLPHGSLSVIAKKLGVSIPYVSKALKEGKPGNRAVQEALRMAKECGALEAAKTLASISA